MRLTRAILDPPPTLERPARRLQALVARGFDALPHGMRVLELLRGRAWLGHPLHPMLTDLVSGAWTVAWTFDLLEALGVRRLRAGADAAIALGIAGTLPTALAGAADWHTLEGAPRRIGLVHAGLNAATTLSYGASLVQRMRSRRVSGHLWGHAAYLLLAASTYLGGSMVFNAGVAVSTELTRHGTVSSPAPSS